MAKIQQFMVSSTWGQEVFWGHDTRQDANSSPSRRLGGHVDLRSRNMQETKKDHAEFSQVIELYRFKVTTPGGKTRRCDECLNKARAAGKTSWAENLAHIQK